jgi:hypothetical protein
MSKVIKDTQLGQDLVSYDDAIFRAEDIAAADTFLSSEFRLGNTDAGVEVKMVATSAFTLLDTKTITFSLQTAAASGGSFAKLVEFGKVTASGDTDIAVGDVLASYILPTEEVGKPWAKVEAITDAAQAGALLDGYIVGL